MTYLELVNDVLVRLRESTVSTVGETTYSSLIGKFVNDAKRQIEDSYSWNCLSTVVTVTTAATQAHTLLLVRVRSSELMMLSIQPV